MKKISRSKLKLSAIREWSVQIIRPKKRARVTFEKPGTAEPTNEVHNRNNTSDNTASNDPHKRLQDSVSASKLKRNLKLDRRATNNERRVSSDPSYKGPVRRYTIDRRMKLHDRRSGS